MFVAGGEPAASTRLIQPRRVPQALLLAAQKEHLPLDGRPRHAGPPRAWRRRRSGRRLLRTPPEGALLPEQGEAGALTLPCVLGQDARCVCARPRVAPPCLLRVPDACPVRVPRPVGP
jgi:hypothetical protein